MARLNFTVTDMNQRKPPAMLTKSMLTKAMLPKITHHERNTILAALRAWQATPAARLGFYNLATNGGEARPLTDAEIDELCQRLDVRT